MAFKAKTVRPTNQELQETVGRVAAASGQLPTTQPPSQPAPTARGRAGPAAAEPTVLVNFKATIPFAKLIAEVSGQEGGVRRMLARMMKEAGHAVPERDLNPIVNRRLYD